MSIRPSAKTPYEIRLELLQLAQLILQSNHNALGVCNGDNLVSSPTTEEIITEAVKLNGFISNPE